MCLWSIVVGEIMDQLVTAGAFQQQINVWGWNQQPIPIINQWKFATNKKMSSLWVASFSKSRGFFPQQNHQITRPTSQARRGVGSYLGTCSDGWMRILKCQSELVRSHKGFQFMNSSSTKPGFQFQVSFHGVLILGRDLYGSSVKDSKTRMSCHFVACWYWYRSPVPLQMYGFSH